MRRHIIIIIFSIILFILGGYAMYTEVLNNKNEEKIKEFNDSKNINIKEYSKEDFDKIVCSWLGLSSLLNKKSLNDMTNQERLRMIIDMYNGEDKYDIFNQSELEKIHKNSVIKNLDITYEDLYNYYGTFLWDDVRLVGFEYDKDNKTFKYTGALGHGGISYGNIAYSDMISMDTDGVNYTVKYKYVFINTSGDGPSDATLYLNIKDALTYSNEWVKLEVGEDNSTHSEEYIKEHYNEIKDKLQVYTYKFKVENDNLVITDFSVE